ncbi:meiotic recombination protein W68 [Leptopilina boulardi]|uniref:meiotic recombination protein W68 n=1 Tax=Leptopilina boulardi TaxID=63433 RepID=UPI0021F569E8|nr:meiotic recombination protein W68 [Leptopilina boulardi]
MDEVGSRNFTRAIEIEEICFQLMEQIINGRAILKINSEDSSSSIQETDEFLFDSNDSKKCQKSINFKRKTSRGNFTLTINALQRAHQMLLGGLKEKINIRSFFYELKPYYVELKVEKVNNAVENIRKLLNCNRWDLGFTATSKGLVAGDITLKFQDKSIVYKSSQGDLIPQEINELCSIETNAKYILVVEKDTVFQKLIGNREKLLVRENCIMITGKGEPDIPTRILVNYLSEIENIPTFILVDNNPHGFEIMCTYRFGSKNHKQWAAPSARWLGIHPIEMKPLQIKTTTLKEIEKSKLNSLMIRNDIQLSKELKKQLKKMKKIGKADVESVMKLGTNYFSTSYIPVKIKLKEFY